MNLTKENLKDIYELSPMQKGMIFQYMLEPKSTAYVEQFDFKLRGKINPSQMRNAFTYLINKYDILRTVFTYGKTDEPRQIVLKEWKTPFSIVNFNKSGTSLLEEFKQKDRERGFNLKEEIPTRITLVNTEEDTWNLILSFHHIIMDGWSLGPLLTELFSKYHEENMDIEPNQYLYKDYIKWVNQQDQGSAKKYWGNYLLDYKKSIGLPTPNGQKKKGYSQEIRSFNVTSEQYEKMKKFTKKHHITLNTVFHSIWGLLLQKFNNTQDVVYGNVVSGRSPHIIGIEKMVGLFINTLPIRVSVEEEMTFLQLCKKLQEENFSSNKFDFYPLYEIQSLSPLRNNLINHVVAFENYPMDEQLKKLKVEKGDSFYFESLSYFEQTNYDLHIVVNPDIKFNITFVYNKNIYDENFMQIVERSFLELLNTSINNHDELISSLKVCSDFDESQIINQSLTVKNRDVTLIDTFKKNVTSNKNEIAIIFKEQQYSYEFIDNWSDALAGKLQLEGVKAGDKVGLYFPRCPELIVSILAVLKIGGIYVPLDLVNNVKRTGYIISDANVKHVITNAGFRSDLEGIENLFIVSMEESINLNKTDLRRYFTRDSANAYLMYTSGSTGNPKGCLISQNNILSFVNSLDFINWDNVNRLLQIGSPAFDACTFEIWGALLKGKTLVIAEQEQVLDPDKFKELINKNSIDIFFLTTSLFNKFSDFDASVFENTQYVLVGGEAGSVKHFSQVVEACPNTNLINIYGPTENTAFSMHYLIGASDSKRINMPIGKPLKNTLAYVFDMKGNILPDGAIGELYLSGFGVGQGYYNKPSLSKEKFIKNPYYSDLRLYKTGDLVRKLPNGNFEFVERIDTQVKIRGYRIELGEIEQIMMKLEGIMEVVVTVKNIRNEHELCAYFTASNDVCLDSLKHELKTLLPRYMIPGFFCKLDKFVLNNNGKINHSKLPEPEIIYQNKAPRKLNVVEENIIAICSNILEVDINKLNSSDNFFEIGFNSLNLVTLNNRLKKEYSIDIPLTTLFEFSSVDKLAKYLTTSEDTSKINSRINQKENEEQKQLKNSLMKSKTLLQRLGGKS
ncbi:amino acid adenylation domain-containing protein [Shouchella hunanensis]|uniref:Amino acid adenylation domain-containing protein n=1 Tax=Shouchella hunanensis TaxID=766894 RepID=A0ABY7W3J0_9BACI|nr:amino acid adenylation domain-containing protein [Shouchella hunanensis]WDF02036.1 amino acid adenylation domain-containing protein [Shouchella hunanensis]